MIQSLQKIIFLIACINLQQQAYSKTFRDLKKAFKKFPKGVRLFPKKEKGPLPGVLSEKLYESADYAASCTYNKTLLGDNFHTVEKNKLYRSAQLRPDRLKHYIKQYGIKTVINLRGKNPHQQWWLDEKHTVENSGALYCNMSMQASIMTSRENLALLLSLYESAPGPILIHCQAGADRTGEAAALWVLEQQRKNKKEALKQLSPAFGHSESKYPYKKRLIRMWQGRNWLLQEYDPSEIS